MLVDVRYNTPGKYNMFGNLITQQWARDALPVIVEHAKVGKVIRYEELRSAIGATTNRKMGRVCAIISTTLYQLEHNELKQRWRKGHIPRLTNIVVKTNGKPGAWMCEQITGDRNIAPSPEEYKAEYVNPVFDYQHWDEVLETLTPESIDSSLTPESIDSSLAELKDFFTKGAKNKASSKTPAPQVISTPLTSRKRSSRKRLHPNLKMKYLENLNLSQQKAVVAPLGPVSVLAGPGSGKTRVLTARIQHLFYTHNLAPSRIRAVTFTQNGTQTMRERLVGDGLKDVRISTFHSLCRDLIEGHFQRHAPLVDLCKAAGVGMPFCWHSFQPKSKQPHLEWYKKDGRLTPDVALWIAFQYACVAFLQKVPPQLDFTKAGYQRVTKAFARVQPRLNPVYGFAKAGMPELTLLGNFEGLCRFRDYVRTVFGYELQIADELHRDYQQMVCPFSRNDPQLETFFRKAYSQLVKRYAFLDFTAQVLCAHQILCASPEALRHLQSQYDALLIDEFQDTDPVQFDIARRIVETHKNLFVVGDHNQAIYGFRGADARNISRFRNVFPDAYEVLLDKNYRSTPQIVEVSRAVVERYQDTDYVFPTAVKSSGAPVEMKNRLRDVPISDPEDVLVLSSTNRRVRENCKTLKAMGIPYVRTVRFAEDGEKRVFCVRKKITDRVLEVMSFLREPTREHTLTAALHVAGIGEKTLEFLVQVSDLSLEPKLEVLFDFRDSVRDLTVASQIQAVCDASGRSPEGQPGIFKGASIDWHSDSVRSDVSFLGRVLTQYESIPTYETLLEASAQVMTVHQAKGMEAPVVIVDGYSFFAVGDGVLASKESVYEAARVMYVALSRAERELYLVTDQRDYPNMPGVYEIIERKP